MENLENKIKLKNINMDTSKVNENNPFLFVLSRRTKDWNNIGEVEKSGYTQAIKQYQSYPMIGFEESNRGKIINNYRDLEDLTDVTTEMLSNLGEQLDKSQKIMFVLHGRDLLNGEVIQSDDYNNVQMKELERETDTLVSPYGKIHGSYKMRVGYFISRVLPKMKKTKKATVWSFQHEGSQIGDALNSKGNIYEKLLSATSDD